MSTTNPPNPQLNFDLNSLPVAHLESLKYKCHQLIDSIQALQRTIECGGQNYMPPWPDILSKYNVLVSQSLNFSNTLLAPLPGTQRSAMTGSGAAPNAYARIALHPSVGMSDAQLDNEVIPLLRNQQTTEVLRVENETVRRLAAHMATQGSLGVLLGPSAAVGGSAGVNGKTGPKVEYEDVLRECEEIRARHDQRADRAVRAVLMLRDKFEWKSRVEVEVEEPEDLDWDPRLGVGSGAVGVGAGDAVGDPLAEDGAGDLEVEGNEDVGMDTPSADGGQSSDEDEVEEGLVDVAADVTEPTPSSPSHGAVAD
jgi:hypothetical protein